MTDPAYCDQIKNEMQDALLNKEFHVFLQPKVNMITSRVYGAEALSRWIHPVDGTRKADDYIPVLEESGFIVNLDLYVFEEVCRAKARWHGEKAEYAEIPISVNMSRRHLFDEEFVDKLHAIVKKYDIDPSELEIEITESVYLNDYTVLIDVVSRLQEIGFYVSIDDFGSGYSALNMLKDIPVNTIKIDKEFLQLSSNTDRGKKVIKNIIILCKDLKLNVTVEGVETEEQVQFLTKYGCEIAQGFYYSKAVPIEEFEEYTRDHFVVTVDVIKFSFNDTLLSDDGRFEAIYSGDKCEFVKGISPSIKAVHFPGGKSLENSLSLPTEGIIHNDSYSVSMWVKTDKLYSWTATIFAEYENGFFQFCPLSEFGTACFRIRDRRSVEAWFDAKSPTLEEGKWYHIVMTYNRMKEKSSLYVNGQLAGWSENVEALYFLKRLIIGSDIYKPTFEGSICEVIFYDKAVDEESVSELYDQYISMEDFDAFD